MSETVQDTPRDTDAVRVPQSDSVPAPVDGTVTPRKDQPASARRSPWGTVAWLVCCALVVVFVAGAWFRLRDEHGGDALIAQLSRGKHPVAPALPTRGIAGDGAPSTTGLATDRPTVVNFWASWCLACIDEMPALRDMADDYGDRVDFVGVDAGNEDTLSGARRFVRKHKVTYAIVRGDRADKNAWGVQGYPETFVVGADGTISWHLIGAVDKDELRAVLDHELERGRS
jgi:cytochrome c biogenesis protein CcmG/thiol:disulfide interchange protein DsbE